MKLTKHIIIVSTLLLCFSIKALPQSDSTFKIFQFPANMIPRIDGNTDDWSFVPESYVVGSEYIWDDSRKHSTLDPKNLNIKVRVGWVKGMNRLYFLYKAWDNYWDFSRVDLHHDIFEIVVDMDQRLVAFQNESTGRITSWTWDFGDGTTSSEQHPLHTYARSGRYIVTLNIEGPDGKSRRAKVWDVAVKSAKDNVKSN